MAELRLVEEREPSRVDGPGQLVRRADYQPIGGHERRGVAFERLADRGCLDRVAQQMLAGGVLLDRPADGRTTISKLARDADQTMLVGCRKHLVDTVDDTGERRDERPEARQRRRKRRRLDRS